MHKENIANLIADIFSNQLFYFQPKKHKLNRFQSQRARAQTSAAAARFLVRARARTSKKPTISQKLSQAAAATESVELFHVLRTDHQFLLQSNHRELKQQQ